MKVLVAMMFIIVSRLWQAESNRLTAFKTISMRIRGAKSEMSELGLDTEGMVESTAKLREEIMALSGVDIMLNNNEFKSTYQIMEELADKWQDLSDIQQATVTELIAGKRQGNIVSSLMNNFDIAQKALETSLNSSGSAMAEHAKWQQSLEAQILKLKAAWQSLSQSFMDSNFLKGAMDAIIGLVDAVNWLIDTFGTLPTLIGAFAAFESFQGVGFFNTIKDEATGAATGITSAFSKIKVAIDNVKNDSTISFDTGFTQSLADDETALLRYRLALNSGMTAQEAFNATMQNASPAAQQYAKTVQITGESVQKFTAQQKISELSMKAQDKSWGNCSKLINSYNKSMQTCGLTQEQFRDSIQASNPALHKYLSGLNGANATFGGYIKSLVSAKVATFALEAATLALNAAITMGISALVSFAIKAFDEMYESADELSERIDEVISKFNSQQKELVKNKSSFVSDAERYAELSKGIDALGRNVSLTTEEYSEYQSVVNSVAEQIPSLISGYDSQGNAILNVKGNVEELVAAYEKLIEAQNREVLTSAGDIAKDFNNSTKKASENTEGWFGWGWTQGLNLGSTKLSTESAKVFKDILNSKDAIAEIDKIISDKPSSPRDPLNQDVYDEVLRDFKALSELLEDAGFEKENGFLNFESDEEHVKRAFKENKNIVSRVLDDFYADLEAETDGMKSVAEAALSNAFDIRTSDYYGMNDTLKNVARQVVNGFDYEFFAGLEADGISVEDYVNDMLDQLDSISGRSTEKIETAFDLQTQFNGGEISYGEYVKGLEDTGKLIDGLGIDEELKTQLKLSIGLNEAGIVDEYQKLVNKLSDHTNYDFDARITSGVAKEFLNSLSAEELSVAIPIITEMSDNDVEESIQDIRAAINREMAVQGLTFDLNFEIEAASIDAFNTALAESVTASGLSSDSISALKGRYAELENQGYDLSAMFEETSNGIHLNRKAVGELERAYAKQKQTDITEDLQSLQKEYDLLTSDINNCNDASERASLYVQRDAIAQQINDAATLAAQYKGLTSAYNDWLAAEEAGQERDMYENIIEGLENIDDEISRGWLDDGTIEFLELLTGKDLSTSSIDDLTAAYKGLKEEIGDSGYSIRDFFTVNKDGDSTNAGVYNFLETIESFDKLKSAIQRDSETGKITGFNFKVVGGDEAIAEALGISEELVQIMVRAADDAGFVVTLDGTYTQLADLKAEAESANDALKKLHTTSNGKFGTDYTFDFAVSNIEDATTELDKALEVLNQYKKNGVIDLEMEGADEALKVAETLQIVKNKLEEPVYMSIETSKLQEDLQEPVELLQEYERLTQERDLLNLSGEDTERLNEIDTELTNIATELNNLPEDTKVKLGIDDLNVDQIKEELENGTIEIPTELTIEANMDKSLEDLVTLGLLEQGLITEKEARIRLGLEVDEVDTSAIEEALDGAELNKDQEVEILAVAEVLGVEDVETLSEKLDGLDDKTVEAIAKVLGQIDVEKLKEVIDGLDDKTVEAIAKAIGEGNVSSLVKTISGLDDKTVQAIAEAFGFEDVEGLKGAVKNLDGKTVKAVAEVLGITDVDSLRKAISRLDGKTVEAVANVFGENKVSSLKSAIDSLKDKTINVVTNFIENGSKKGESAAGKRTGSNLKVSDVNGTANAYGTAGKAFKQGDWSTKKSETALVGELGREIVVTPDNRWHTVGDNGAEFTHIPRGSIVFNHKQTESLLKNGYVTGRGKAYACGSAFASGINNGISSNNDIDIELKKYIHLLNLYSQDVRDAVNTNSEISQQMIDAGNLWNDLTNGNVDYNKRPLISPEKMRSYYPEFDGEVGTTYSQYWTVGDGEALYTIDITPILEDGTVLSQDSLNEYVNSLVTTNGVSGLLESDKNNLIIDVQSGDYDEEYWSNYQNNLGEVKNAHWELVKQLQGKMPDDVFWELNEVAQNCGLTISDIAKKTYDLQNNNTESLLKNGYVTGRGKAYASGTSGNRKWFAKGAFEDGWQLFDGLKTLIGSKRDLEENATAGFLGLGEKLTDGLMMIGGAITDAQAQKNATDALMYHTLTGNQEDGENLAKLNTIIADQAKSEAGEFVQKDLYDENEIAKTLLASELQTRITGIDPSVDSVFGEKSDELVQSAGELVGTAALNAAGVPWWLTSGASAWGSEAESALNHGATFEEANLSGLVSAATEILLEKVGGITFGGKTLSGALSDKLTMGISNEFVKKISEFGLESVLLGEGTEEVFSDFVGRFAQGLIGQGDQKLSETLFSKEAFDSYLDSYIGGFILGEGNNLIKKSNFLNQHVLNGADKIASFGDPITNGLTRNISTGITSEYSDYFADELGVVIRGAFRTMNSDYGSIISKNYAGGGTYFSNSSAESKTYGGYKISEYNPEARAIRSDLLMKNPYIVNANGSFWREIIDDNVYTKKDRRKSPYKEKDIRELSDAFEKWNTLRDSLFNNEILSTDDELKFAFDDTLKEVYATYLSKNLSPKKKLEKYAKFDADLNKKYNKATTQRKITQNMNQLHEYALANGHDGLIVLNVGDTYEPNDQYVVFSEEQIRNTSELISDHSGSGRNKFDGYIASEEIGKYYNNIITDAKLYEKLHKDYWKKGIPTKKDRRYQNDTSLEKILSPNIKYIEKLMDAVSHFDGDIPNKATGGLTRAQYASLQIVKAKSEIDLARRNIEKIVDSMPSDEFDFGKFGKYPEQIQAEQDKISNFLKQIKILEKSKNKKSKNNDIDKLKGNVERYAEEMQNNALNFDVLDKYHELFDISNAKIAELEGKIAEIKGSFVDSNKNAAHMDNASENESQEKLVSEIAFNPDTTSVDEWIPNNKDALVMYSADYTNVDTSAPPTKYGTIIYTESGGKSGGDSGVSNVNGTAFANGTSGVAFKQGDWRTKKTETALTGELGREIVVTPDNRWHTVGDNGAEFVNIPRGSIVFNHKQTEELLANGKVTSGGGRGRAFAGGTAYAMHYKSDSGSTGYGGIGKVTENIAKKVKDTVENAVKKSGSTGSGGGTGKSGGSSKKSSGSGGGSGGSGGGSSKDEKEFEETIDWIETAIDRIERAIDKLDLKANSIYKTWSERNTALVDQIGKVGDEIDLQQKAYDRYIKQANSVGLSESYAKKVRDGTIDIQTITDEDLSEKIKDYQQWYNKALDCQKTIEELKETEASLYQQRFENVSTQYEGILGTIEHEKNMLEEYINQSETQGWLVAYEYYHALSSNEKRNIAELEKQKADMVAEFNAAMDSGTITKGSEAYYDMVNAIDEVSLSLEQANTRVMEISQTAQQLKWEQFDLLQDKISAITEETEFLIELMSSDKLFDENGQLTDSGMATMGQYGVAYNVLMQQADQARAEAERLERERARNLYNGTDKYDQDLEERYQEMIALQREYILAAEDQKEAIRDLVEEGIQLELDALDEKIEKYKDSLDSARDLYEYNKKVKEQSKEIANLEKQRAAYLGDASEEGKAKLQKIEVSLEEAKTELYETEMDKVIDNTSALLDELYLEYEEILNTRLDNIDALISDMIVEINANASTINGTISEKADSVGYVLSDSMESIWNTNSVEINSVITTYGEKFSSAQTATNSALKTINDNLQSMISQLNTIANTNIKSASVSSAKNYAVGKYDFSDDEVAWTQDGGKEFIVRPSDGAILTPIAKRDSVLTSVASRNIWDMANSPAEFIKDNLKLDTSNVPNGTNVHSNYTQHLEKVVFNFPNVKNYDDMLSAMQKDRNFERLINSITIDQIAGKSSLGKGKSIR